MAKQLPESSSGGEMSGGSILGSVISPAMPFSVLALESRHRHLPDRQANLQQTPWDLPNGSLFWKLQQEESSMPAKPKDQTYDFILRIATLTSAPQSVFMSLLRKKLDIFSLLRQ
nr:uncharacterized protein LOC125418209 isoform X1 [Ziziphus jujuba var. spinosa]